jgi:hypothetical protein
MDRIGNLSPEASQLLRRLVTRHILTARGSEISRLAATRRGHEHGTEVNPLLTDDELKSSLPLLDELAEQGFLLKDYLGNSMNYPRATGGYVYDLTEDAVLAVICGVVVSAGSLAE